MTPGVAATLTPGTAPCRISAQIPRGMSSPAVPVSTAKLVIATTIPEKLLVATTLARSASVRLHR